MVDGTFEELERRCKRLSIIRNIKVIASLSAVFLILTLLTYMLLNGGSKNNNDVTEFNSKEQELHNEMNSVSKKVISNEVNIDTEEIMSDEKAIVPVADENSDFDLERKTFQ